MKTVTLSTVFYRDKNIEMLLSHHSLFCEVWATGHLNFSRASHKLIDINPNSGPNSPTTAIGATEVARYEFN